MLLRSEDSALLSQFPLQVGTLEHQSLLLSNLQAAMRQTQRLCAVMVENSGRETVVRSKPCCLKQSPPMHVDRLTANPKEKVGLSSETTLAYVPPGTDCHCSGHAFSVFCCQSYTGKPS